MDRDRGGIRQDLDWNVNRRLVKGEKRDNETETKVLRLATSKMLRRIDCRI
jgi:hypothetical protein